jgi:hypothetical protein
MAASRASVLLAKSLVSCTWREKGSMSGANRALNSTLTSKLRALAFAAALSMRCSS